MLIAPEWIDDINWSEGRFVVNLSRHAVRNSPPYDPVRPLTRDLETDTCKHYGRDGHWPREGAHSRARASA